MSRHIDADRLQERLLEIAKKPWNKLALTSWKEAYEEFASMLDLVSEADVRENVRWVFCNTSEPETSGDYLLYRPHFWGANKGQITVCYWNCHEWSDNYRSDAERYLPVIDGMAWMPLPEPYKEEDDAEVH